MENPKVRDEIAIVGRGKRTYFDPQDDTQRLAMSAIVINLSAASEKLPESVLAANPQIPWRDLKDTRNYLAHDYAGVDHRIIWNTAVISFPELSGHVRDLREQF